MQDAARFILCDCGETAQRVFGNFYCQEDRYRFFRNPIDGTSYSYSLGREHPDNRVDYHRACEELGSEPVTPKTMPVRWKEDQEYREHVNHGGAREERAPIGSQKPVGKTVLEQLQRSGIRVG